MGNDDHLPPGAREGLAAWETGERAQYYAAASRACDVYPGALGELLHRELVAYAEFGHRLAADGLIDRLATEVLTEAGSPEAPGFHGATRGADR